MDHSDDLWKAMKTALKSNGDLINLRTKLEESIIETLQQPSVPQFMSETMSLLPTRTSKPAMPPEILLTNSLISQYLRHAGLQQTADVLSVECGLPKTQASETVLQAKFPSLNCPKGKSFLCYMVNECITHKERHDGEEMPVKQECEDKEAI